MKKTVLMGLALGATLALAGAAQAADAEAGKAKYNSVCASCHGAQGQGMAIFPKVSGQSADQVAASLKAYRAGETKGPNTALMAPHAKALSDDDIANVAAFISSL